MIQHSGPGRRREPPSHAGAVSLQLYVQATADPTYRRVYREHLRDEARHVQLDRHLIARFYHPAPRAVRWSSAQVFTLVLTRWLLPPVRSAARVVGALARECCELRPLLPVMRRQLHHVATNPGYQAMMYSRAATPLLFAEMDRCPLLRRLGRRIPTYRPEATHG